MPDEKKKLKMNLSKKPYVRPSLFKDKSLKDKKPEKPLTLAEEDQNQMPLESNKNLKDETSEKKKSDSNSFVKNEKSVHQRLKQALEDNLYLRAEFENFKKRSLKEKSQLIRYSGEEFISALANEVLDDLDRALLSSLEKKSYEDLKKGLKMIHKKLSQVLTRFGVEVLDPLGQGF